MLSLESLERWYARLCKCWGISGAVKDEIPRLGMKWGSGSHKVICSHVKFESPKLSTDRLWGLEDDPPDSRIPETAVDLKAEEAGWWVIGRMGAIYTCLYTGSGRDAGATDISYAPDIYPQMKGFLDAVSGPGQGDEVDKPKG